MVSTYTPNTCTQSWRMQGSYQPLGLRALSPTSVRARRGVVTPPTSPMQMLSVSSWRPLQSGVFLLLIIALMFPQSAFAQSPTATSTATSSSTGTVSPLPSESLVTTLTASRLLSPTSSPSLNYIPPPTGTVAGSVSSTFSTSLTPTVTLTPSLSSTHSNSLTVSGTVSITGTQSFSQTVSQTFSPTISFTVTQSYSVTTTITTTYTVSSTHSNSHSGSSSYSRSPTVSVCNSRTMSQSPTLTPSVTLSPSPSHTSSPSISTSPSISVSGTNSHSHCASGSYTPTVTRSTPPSRSPTTTVSVTPSQATLTVTPSAQPSTSTFPTPTPASTPSVSPLPGSAILVRLSVGGVPSSVGLDSVVGGQERCFLASAAGIPLASILLRAVFDANTGQKASIPAFALANLPNFDCSLTSGGSIMPGIGFITPPTPSPAYYPFSSGRERRGQEAEAAPLPAVAVARDLQGNTNCPPGNIGCNSPGSYSSGTAGYVCEMVVPFFAPQIPPDGSYLNLTSAAAVAVYVASWSRSFAAGPVASLISNSGLSTGSNPSAYTSLIAAISSASGVATNLIAPQVTLSYVSLTGPGANVYLGGSVQATTTNPLPNYVSTVSSRDSTIIAAVLAPLLALVLCAVLARYCFYRKKKSQWGSDGGEGGGAGHLALDAFGAASHSPSHQFSLGQQQILAQLRNQSMYGGSATPGMLAIEDGRLGRSSGASHHHHQQHQQQQQHHHHHGSSGMGGGGGGPRMLRGVVSTPLPTLPPSLRYGMGGEPHSTPSFLQALPPPSAGGGSRAGDPYYDPRALQAAQLQQQQFGGGGGGGAVGMTPASMSRRMLASHLASGGGGVLAPGAGRVEEVLDFGGSGGGVELDGFMGLPPHMRVAASGRGGGGGAAASSQNSVNPLFSANRRGGEY